MNVFNAFKGYILPREIDFFGSLKEQCQITEDIINELSRIYIDRSEDVDKLHTTVENAKKLRSQKLIELNGVLITPVDKEAISRIYTNLYWIVLSIKHLDVELSAYQIKALNEYENIFSNLKNQMEKMTDCFVMLKNKNYNEVLTKVYEVIHLDNLLIKEYATLLEKLFAGHDIKRILQHKEVLSQLKEISKRIHFCANSIEDVVFKIN